MNDTNNIFVLLIHHYYIYASHHLIRTVKMDATINGRTLTDSAETVKKNTDIVPQQLAAHGLTIL